MNQEVTNARRMAQTAWMVLALYTFFGFCQLGGEVEISIGGLTLTIPKKYLDWGFPFFSLYATGFFYYIAFQKNRSPFATRRYFRNFKNQQMPVELMKNTGTIEMGIFRSYIATFFPKLDPYSFKFTKSDTSGNYGDQQKINSSEKVNIEWPDGVGIKTRCLCMIENLLYVYPLLCNVGFLVFYKITVCS